MSRITLRRLAFTLPLALGALGNITTTARPATAMPTDPVQLAACDFGRQLTTYDYTAYDDYDQRVLARSTGPFRDDFLRSAIGRRARALTGHTRSEALAVQCSTDAADATHAQMVVTVDQTTTSDATAGAPQPDHAVLRVALDNIGGHWLADQVITVQPYR